MAEVLFIPQTNSREEVYISIVPQIQALIAGETNFISNSANAMAAIMAAFQFLWVGCYFILENELVLGPFQGPIACTRISKGKGVCGKSWENEATIIVPDVDLFPGHIACSSASRSEIVIPMRNKNGKMIGVIDIDSIHVNDFSEVDRKYLEMISKLLGDSYNA